MPQQLDLFDLTLDKRFWEFHQENPHVYVALVRMARRLKAVGRTHYGIGALFEALRFESAIKTNGDEWKLNNNHRALYVRLIERNEPDLRGFFEMRQRHGPSRGGAR